MVYVRQEFLPNLKEYKYASVDQSLTSKYILKPFYTHFVIKLFPMSMAPNLITLSGFSFIIANILTLLWYNPTLDQDCPSWVYYSWAAGLFLYQTFDAVDGSQARRTRQSGPLGELFDHGVDALNTSLGALIFAGAPCRSGRSHAADHWRAGAASCAPSFIYNASFTEWYLTQGGVVLVLNTLESTRNVIQARRARGDRSRGALLGLGPFFAAWAFLGSYLYLHPTILHNHLVPFTVFAGIVNAYSVGQMITAHLVKLPFPYWNVLVIPVAFGVLDSLGPQLLARGLPFGWPSALGDGVYQVSYMFLMLGMAVGVYGSFVVDVIVTICDYLDIWCLTIKHPYVEGVDEKTEKQN
ncbi:choline/ethanolaminephosphotransferase [Verticillium dahliae VdLs.17]|uniref:Choline/ethanolaminephosphotransferase n=1 Tax=Verticillium dahliae (strain VdLs.17 / ATCC MYA-4575 / FGSC 10137) TaxID=498257 RepID=G2WY79_VERDV|nr:choline/ethanolaminephosphotransferase [Verticillium dahliae VdLs.17]EGY21037.1 choline/ethanolaminephosphotransferase [Verticillium dahliae VdLs.17]